MYNKWLINLTFLCIALVTLFWSLATPIFETPDEQAHIGTVTYLAEQGRSPKGQEWDMTEEMRQTQEYLGVFRDPLGNNDYTYHPEHRPIYTPTNIGYFETEILELNNPIDRGNYVAREAARYPRLYYDYMSLFYNLVKDSDIITRTYVMRLGGVILTITLAVVTYQIGLLLFANLGCSLILTLLVMLHPMHSFLLSGINSDNLHNLLWAVIIYLGISVVRCGINARLLIAIVLVVVLDIMTKPQGYIAIPVLLLAIVVRMVATRQYRLVGIGLFLATVGTILFLSPLNRYKSWLFVDNNYNLSLSDFALSSLQKLISQNIVWYWGVYKWLGVVLPPIFWQVANRLVLVSGLGLLIYAVRSLKGHRLRVGASSVAFLLLTVITYSLAIYYFDYQYQKSLGHSIGVQARYLYPTLTAQMALLIIGLTAIFKSRLMNNIILTILVLFIIGMQLGGIHTLLASYYDLTPLSTFVTQVSQYKPWFAKGEWWYFWISLYLLSMIYLTIQTLKSIKRIKQGVT